MGIDMPSQSALAKIDLHLIEILHTLLTTQSVSRSAVRLGMHQPAVSAALRRLRELLDDPILVRSGGAMVPTDIGCSLAEPAAAVLREADRLLSGARDRRFDPATSTATLRLAASDYLDPLFLPTLVSELRQRAPGLTVEVQPLSVDLDYRKRLAAGEVDLVIGNWLRPPADLHLGRLFSDEVVCLVSARHPAARRPLTVQRYLDCDHVSPNPTHPGAVGVIDDHLAAQGLVRRIVARVPYFGMIPRMVADGLLVLTTGRLFCSRYVGTLPVRIVACPVPFPPLRYFQLWHERTHRSPGGRFLRDLTRDVAGRLRAIQGGGP
jgi:DNA-binding transcriptional LysR family regulator